MEEEGTLTRPGLSRLLFHKPRTTGPGLQRPTPLSMLTCGPRLPGPSQRQCQGRKTKPGGSVLSGLWGTGCAQLADQGKHGQGMPWAATGGAEGQRCPGFVSEARRAPSTCPHTRAVLLGADPGHVGRGPGPLQTGGLQSGDKKEPATRRPGSRWAKCKGPEVSRSPSVEQRRAVGGRRGG